jgi:hypothetical protein
MDQIQYLFLLSPPRCGSTAIIKILNTSPYTMLLHPKGEGLRLVESSWQDAKWWNQKKKVDWEEVKKIWKQKVQKVNQLVETVSLVLEKSPPNIVRADEISNAFPTAKFIVSNRNPYANCASIFYRGYKSSHNIDRKSVFQRLAEDWVVRSQYQIKNIENLNIITLFSYEDFCSHTSQIMNKIADELEEIKYCNLSAQIKVKDYPVSSFQNMNDAQISKLEESDIKVITSVLERHKEVVEYFGYTLIQ